MGATERQMCLQVITKKLVSLTAGCMFLLFIIFYVVNVAGIGRTYLATYVFMAGLIGGFLSLQQRLPAIHLDELRELSKSWLSILLVPINGGVFAIVLMLMFLSGILEGSMFPRYHHPDIDHQDLVNSFAGWLINTFPEKGTDVAKLLFWSFVAGFSERFVPQIIQRTAEHAESQKIDVTRHAATASVANKEKDSRPGADAAPH